MYQRCREGNFWQLFSENLLSFVSQYTFFSRVLSRKINKTFEKFQIIEKFQIKFEKKFQALSSKTKKKSMEF